jgi:hypothetical protein
MRTKSLCLLCCAVFVVLTGIPALAHFDHHHQQQAIIPNLPATPTHSITTVPPNGDVNPYGVAFVPWGFPSGGPLQPGDILVSNFNNFNNLQGTGTTIVLIDPTTSTQSLFFQGQTGLGLTTALGILKRGFVLVGNVPSTNGAGVCTQNGDVEQGVEQGSLIILDKNGNLVKTLSNAEFLDGPWDLTINDEGDFAQLFISNVLSGTVVRLELSINENDILDPVIVLSTTQIASGYLHQCNSAAFVVGPTGLAYDNDRDILYVASTGDNAIFAIRDARRTRKDNGMGKIVVNDAVHLHGPLGLVLAPNGDLITSQGDAVNEDTTHPSEIVEFTPWGKFVAQISIDPAIGGAFGIALHSFGDGFTFAAVDDNTSVLDVWVVK